jgi:hypothetical protein
MQRRQVFVWAGRNFDADDANTWRGEEMGLEQAEATSDGEGKCRRRGKERAKTRD